jgi:hypothetical protein
MREGAVDKPLVTLSVEQLFELAKHTHGAPYRQWLNLRRRETGDYHRCIAVDLIEDVEPKIRFEMQENGNQVTGNVIHTVEDIFTLLPRLRALLAAQTWLPDTFAERAYQTAMQANEDSRVLLTMFESSAIRRWKVARDKE